MSKKNRIIVYLCTIAFFIIMIGGYVAYSCNYNRIYGFASLKNGAINIEGQLGRRVPIRLYGEWEFFYNKWIVSDNDNDADNDGFIKISDYWTVKDGFPRKGFASYRIFFEGVAKYEKFIVLCEFTDVPIRIFLNKRLVFQNGELQKTKTTGVKTNSIEHSFYEASSDGERVEAVIEVGYNERGGIKKVPLVQSYVKFLPSQNRGWYYDIVSYMTMGLFLCVVICSIMLLVITGKEYADLVIGILLSLFIHFIVSVDGALMMRNADYFVLHIFSDIVMTLMPGLMTFLAMRHKWLVFNKKRELINGSVALACLILYLSVLGYNLRFFFLIPIGVLAAYYLIELIINAINSRTNYQLIYALIFGISILIGIEEALDYNGIMEVGSMTIPSYYSILIFILQTLLIVFVFREKAHKKVMSDSPEREEEEEKSINIKITTFGSFNVFVNGNSIEFKHSKVKEILAFLVDKKGGEVSMSEVITALWPDKALDKAKISYRDVVIKLRKVLANNGILDLVNIGRARISLDCNKVAECDVWDISEEAISDYHQEQYMPSYDWAKESLNVFPRNYF